MNCRFAPAAERLRLSKSVRPSHGSAPISSSAALISLSRAVSSQRRSRPRPSTASAPVRMSVLSARSPSSRLSASIRIDLPAPVSPVSVLKPGPEFPGQVLDQRQVPDAQRNEHGGIWTGLTRLTRLGREFDGSMKDMTIRNHSSAPASFRYRSPAPPASPWRSSPGADSRRSARPSRSSRPRRKCPGSAST